MVVYYYRKNKGKQIRMFKEFVVDTQNIYMLDKCEQKYFIAFNNSIQK